MTSEIVNVYLIVGHYEPPHPAFELGKVVAFNTLHARLSLIHFNLVSHPIYQQDNSIAQCHYVANISSENGRHQDVFKVFVEVKLRSNLVSEEALHLLPVSDAETHILLH